MRRCLVAIAVGLVVSAVMTVAAFNAPAPPAAGSGAPAYALELHRGELEAAVEAAGVRMPGVIVPRSGRSRLKDVAFIDGGRAFRPPISTFCSVVRTGFPFRDAEWVHYGADRRDAAGSTRFVSGGTLRPRTIEGPLLGEFRVALPPTLLPFGLVLNVVAYASLAVVLLVGLPTVRRMRRLARDLCEGCGHPLGRSTRCSECGRPRSMR